jgi:hypothetical protein
MESPIREIRDTHISNVIESPPQLSVTWLRVSGQLDFKKCDFCSDRDLAVTYATGPESRVKLRMICPTTNVLRVVALISMPDTKNLYVTDSGFV